MRKSKTIYRAVNEVTGEVYEGTVEEVAISLGTSGSTVNKAALDNRKFGKCWVITKIGKTPSVGMDGNYAFPKELLEEWDAVTLRFRMASRKKINS